MEITSGPFYTTSSGLLESVDSKRNLLINQLFYQSTVPILTIVEKLMVILRDGRKLIGILRSFDQFGMSKVHVCTSGKEASKANGYMGMVWEKLSLANLVLQDTIERIYVGNCYGDIPRGIFLIRGENVVLLGEIVSIL